MSRLFVNLTGIIIAIAVAACGASGGTQPPPANTGITGQVLLGPMCPVQTEYDPCPDQPIEAKVKVLNQIDEEVANVQTDKEGRFTVDLPPGTYSLVPDVGGGGLGFTFGKPMVVDVIAGRYTEITLKVDTGIR